MESEKYGPKTSVCLLYSTGKQQGREVFVIIPWIVNKKKIIKKMVEDSKK